MKKLILGVLALVASSSSFAAVNATENFTLTSGSGTQMFRLHGVKSSTIYEYRQVETTCYRTEYTTDYRRECTPQYREECSTSYESSCTSHPVCRNVSRPVCSGSGGCTDYSTRECTTEESCSSSPRTSCSSVYAGETCSDVPYTRSYEVPYSCMETRAFPIGTQVDEDMLVNAAVAFEGDLSGLTGKDTFSIAALNGLDVRGNDITIVNTNSANTHAFQLRKVSESKRTITGKETEVDAVYKIIVTKVDTLLANASKIEKLGLSRTGFSMVLSGKELDANAQISVSVRKDRLIGGYVTVCSATFGAIKVKPDGAKQKVVFGHIGCGNLNGRPHQLNVTVTRDPSSIIGGDVMNPQSLEPLKQSLTASKSIRVKM